MDFVGVVVDVVEEIVAFVPALPSFFSGADPAMTADQSSGTVTIASLRSFAWQLHWTGSGTHQRFGW